MNHLWQRFLLASSLIVGLLIGVAVTVFGYSNLVSVNVRWSILHLDGIPLWTVAVVPLALFLVAGTLYHWVDGLHHFSEHMRHRHLVRELEAEVASLRAHLDQVLEMPDHSTSRLPARKASTTSLPPVEKVVAELDGPTPMAVPVDVVPATAKAPALSPSKPRPAQRKRVTLPVAGEPPRPDRPAPHRGGMIGDGRASEPPARLEPKA